jgi:hypothetical protein
MERRQVFDNYRDFNRAVAEAKANDTFVRKSERRNRVYKASPLTQRYSLTLVTRD